MRLCPVCLHSIPPLVEQCPYCQSEIGGGNAIEEDEGIEWTIVRTVTTEIEATLIAGRLRSYGVPAFVLSQVDSTRHFTVGMLAVVKIFVPEGMLDEAQKILATPPEEPDEDEIGAQQDDNPPNQ